MPRLRLPHSLQTMVFTRVSIFPFLRFRARTLQDVHRDLSLELRVAGEQYKDHVDCRCLAAPPFTVGDVVWL